MRYVLAERSDGGILLAARPRQVFSAGRLIDPGGLSAVHARLAAGGDFRERETGLYGLIVMDLALRSFA